METLLDLKLLRKEDIDSLNLRIGQKNLLKLALEKLNVNEKNEDESIAIQEEESDNEGEVTESEIVTGKERNTSEVITILDSKENFEIKKQFKKLQMSCNDLLSTKEKAISISHKVTILEDRAHVRCFYCQEKR